LPENEERLLVFGNEALLLTAIKNIVANACKYSDDKEAKVSLATEGENVVISVTDRGKGIPESEIDNIFQPFYRLEESKAESGFGLGLSMAQRIIKLHKGCITVRSIFEQGTTFTIIIPSATNVSGL
jgi:signal transduction histidine kinase